MSLVTQSVLFKIDAIGCRPELGWNLVADLR